MKLTQAQQAVVENRGGSLLVSAAAGSGKTKVLVERLFRYITEEHCNVDDFLIITYTKAAAAELRSKIASELSARLAGAPEDRHLQSQLLRVYQADIKTVDAFCTALLRENTHLLAAEGDDYSLTPDFRVLDEDEAKLLRVRVLNRVLERFYEELGEDGTLLADTLGAGRDDHALEELVLELHEKLQSHAYPGRWLSENEAQWDALRDGSGEFDDTVYAKTLLTNVARKAGHWERLLGLAVEQMSSCPPLEQQYAGRFARTAECFASLRLAAESGGWDETAKAAQAVDFPRLGTVRGDDGGDLKARMKKLWDGCKEETKKLRLQMDVTGAEGMEDLSAVAPAMSALLRLTAEFGDAYRREKLRQNAADFSDQEHLALKILVNGDGTPTEMGEQAAARYREVLVDEYQDTNEVQNHIFRAVSNGGQNIFTVGDVKQSIYRFRLADPTIFLRKYTTFKEYTEASDGEERKILLSKNFRSRREILDAANFVFENILSVEMGEMEYGDEEALHFGAEYYPERRGCDTEFHLITARQKTEEDPRPVKKTVAEARFAAARIRQLLDERYGVTGEDGAPRPCVPEDFAILMRSPGSRAAIFADALAEQDLPCSFEESGDFFTTMEIAVTRNLLEILDNPRQDVALISVLRSPLFGMSANRLAEIRGKTRDGDFYHAVECDGGEDCRNFLATLERLRADGRTMTVERLLWHLYNELNILGVFGAMEEGDLRRENLIALTEHAARFEASGYRGLFAFVDQLRSLIESGRAPVTRGGSDRGGVRLMSIHKSKGLEFPVVLLCDLDHVFSRQDFDTPVLVHPALGLGPRRVDLERRIQYPTLARQALEQTLRRENLAEEQRILYVAMTRPKEKLILVDSMYHAETRLQRLAASAACPVLPETVGDGKCHGDWILLPLLCRPEAAPLRALAEMEVGSLYTGDTAPWQVAIHDSDEFRDRPNRRRDKDAEENEVSAPFDAALLEFVYPHQRETLLPAKLTATQLKGRALDEEIAEDAPRTPYLRPLTRPRFRQESHGLTAAEAGTATHLVLQYLDFSDPDVAGQVERLRGRRLLSDEQAAAVDAFPLKRFLRSPLAEEIRRSANVLREYRFTLLLSAREVDAKASGGDDILLQGVVDCCFETEQGITVVDFKTDRVEGEAALLERAEYYRPQLEAYSQALERVLEGHVCRRALYFLHPGRTVEL